MSIRAGPSRPFGSSRTSHTHVDLDNSLEEVDDHTAALILQLQLADLEDLRSSSKGKSREDEPTDAEIALSFYRQEVEAQALQLQDRRMAKSITEAIHTDSEVVMESRSEEMRAIRDHHLATQLNNGQETVQDQPPEGDEWPDQVEDELLDKMAVLYLKDIPGMQEENLSTGSRDEHDPEGGVGPSKSWLSVMSINTKGKHRCVACQEEKGFHDVARAPCSHEYCRHCLNDLFECSLTDESLFPPRCCRQQFDSSKIRMFLVPGMLSRFQEKQVEFGTPNRIYCANTACSKFIPPGKINGDDASCFKCGQLTCVICKQASHANDCPEDTSLQEVLQAAAENGWQRCSSCHRLIELDHGCNHITCVCSHQFCYVCGERWKTCDCLQWDENRLEARANQIVNRRPPRNQEVRAVQVNQAVHNLRTRHECDHQRWRYVSGPHQCEECYFNLPQFIFECTQCNMQACRRCRSNRL